MTGMTADEIRHLPAAVDAPTAFRAIGIGLTMGYELLRTGQFPVPALRVGNTYRFATAEIMKCLGLEREEPSP